MELDFGSDYLKNKAVFLLCAACLAMTACGRAVDDLQESLTEDSSMIADVTETEMVSAASETTQTEVAPDTSVSDAALSLPIEDIAHAFAEQVFTALQNNKTADDPIPYAPISTAHEIQSFDPEAMEAELRLLDIDFDGVPELFTTSHGTMGTGGHSIYTADGQFYGYGLYTIDFSDFMTDGKAVYAPSGSNSSFGYTKLAVGLPYVSTNGGSFYIGLETPVNICIDGNKTETTVSSEEEYKKLIENSFGISYDSLQPVDLEHNRYISGYLRVPDPENYTEEDIYGCLLGLLREYEGAALSAFLEGADLRFDTAMEVPACQAADLYGHTYNYYDVNSLEADVLYKIAAFNDGSAVYGLIHKFDTLDTGAKVASTDMNEQAIILRKPDGGRSVYIQDWFCLCGSGMTQAPCDVYLQDIDYDNDNELILRNTYTGSFGQVNCTLDIFKENEEKPITLDNEVIDSLIASDIAITADKETGVFYINVNGAELTYQADADNISSAAFDVESFLPSSYSTFYTVDSGVIKAYMRISGGGMPNDLFFLCAEVGLSGGEFSLCEPWVESYDPDIIPKQYIAEENL